MPKCDFNKVAKQLWNTSQEHLWWAASVRDWLYEKTVPLCWDGTICGDPGVANVSYKICLRIIYKNSPASSKLE